jgi:hypothetical protein
MRFKKMFNTNPALTAQNNLLKQFVKSKYESKSSNMLNFIEIKKEKQNGKKQRVLILTHGFASGLGFYYGLFIIEFPLIIYTLS